METWIFVESPRRISILARAGGVGRIGEQHAERPALRSSRRGCDPQPGDGVVYVEVVASERVFKFPCHTVLR